MHDTMPLAAYLRYSIRQLKVIGSAVRANDANPESSDDDFLVGAFAQGMHPNFAGAFLAPRRRWNHCWAEPCMGWSQALCATLPSASLWAYGPVGL